MISYPHEMIRKLKEEAFGSKSERWVSQEQLVFVFNEAEVEAKKEVSEKLEYQLSVLKVIEYHRLKYEVVSPEGESQVRTAEPLACIIPKGIATASLLAEIIVNKYADGLPLYRHEEIFDRQGVHLPRSTQGHGIDLRVTVIDPLWQ